MPLSHKALVAGGLCVFLLGAVLIISPAPESPGPPELALHSPTTQVAAADSFPSVELLAGPWFRRPKPSVAPPAPAPSAPVTVDRSSVSFMGQYRERDDSRVFIFKYLPTGRVLILKPGRPDKGWALVGYTDKTFSLSGPGGQYEVTR